MFYLPYMLATGISHEKITMVMGVTSKISAYESYIYIYKYIYIYIYIKRSFNFFDS